MTVNISTLEKKIKEAWDFVFENLYDPKTSMIYDFVTGETLEETISNLPTPEEIAASSPNPCGWGTGMEDSTLSICPIIEAMIARYNVTKNPEVKKYIDMMYQGLINNGTIAPEPGFIARCICPGDGKSIYMDSSRDQYTNWVFAAHLLLNTELIDEAQKEALRKILVDIAAKAERDMKSGNDGYMLRLDGKPGVVLLMDSDRMEAHELLRLPMIYMAAYEASGDKHWHDKYLEIRDRLLERTEREFRVEDLKAAAHGDYGFVYGIYQHQYSAKLLYDCEDEACYKERYFELLRRAAEAAEEYINVSYRRIDEICRDEAVRDSWKNVFAKYLFFFENYAYYVPQQFSDDKSMIFKYMRNAAEVVIIQCLCPGYTIPEGELKKFIEFVERAHFSKAASYWPLLFCDAWWLLRETGQIL